jgi:hypothetical protein
VSLALLVFVVRVTQAQEIGHFDKALGSPKIVPAKLDVQLASGDFKSYGSKQTITTPQKVTFRWIPKLQGMAWAKWQVAASSFSASPAPAILLEGSAGTVPEVGHQGFFDIDFAKLVSQNPPAQPKKYYVRITTFTAGRTAVGNTATPQVTVTHAEPAPGTKFTADGLGLTPMEKPKIFPLNNPLWGNFTDLQCIEDTDEWNDDEAYAVMVAIDIKGFQPRMWATRTTVFEDLDAGSQKTKAYSLWGIHGHSEPIANPNHVILLASLLENDSSNPDSVVAIVQSVLTASLANYYPEFLAGTLSRGEMVVKLINDMKGAIGLGIASGGLDFDERIDSPKELKLTPSDLLNANYHHTVVKSLQFWGDDAHYKLWWAFGH